MAARTYEELLAVQTELANFNQNHDLRNGQFAKDMAERILVRPLRRKKRKPF